MASTIDGIFNEREVNFVGKDGFFWWVGEVEDNEDPMELGRVKVRILGFYTNFQGGTVADLPSSALPWATVLQHTSQAGNDGQGESAGQLQPGAVVMGFFMDGEHAQMPIVIGVMRVNKSDATKKTRDFAFTDQDIPVGVAPNNSAIHPGDKNTANPLAPLRQSTNNTVGLPGSSTTSLGGSGSPKNIGSTKGIKGSYANPIKPLDPTQPIPVANGVGGPWKTLEYKLSYLIEDLANTAATLVKAESGEYLDLISGKLITKAELTVNVNNYLGSLFAQVISAMRQALINLAEDLKLTNMLLLSTGVPYNIITAVQTAITKVLTSAVALDASIATYTATPLKTVTDTLDQYLSNSLDKSTFVINTVDTITSNIITDVAKIIKDIGDLTTSITTTVNGVGEATKIITAWEKSTGIFHLQTAVEYDVVNITSIIQLINNFSSDNRSINSSKSLGWYPLVGMSANSFIVTVAAKDSTHVYNGQGSGKGYKIDGRFAPTIPFTVGRTYKFDQSDASNKTHPLLFYREANKKTLYDMDVTVVGTAGESGAYTEIKITSDTPSTLHYQCLNHGFMGHNVQINSLDPSVDQLYDDADPYLTSAKNHVNGSFELYLGTPGRQGEVQKKVNGTTHTSLLYNNSHYAEKKARDQYRQDNPNATEAEIAAAVEDYRLTSTNNRGDIGSTVADHISWAGVLTQEVHGDDCKLVNGTYARTIDGDYHLKVTGNCHLEVGGGFFFSAEGYDASTSMPQKHAIKFGSDVDMNVVGASLELHSSEFRLNSITSKITGIQYENSYQQQSNSGLELTFNAESSIQIVTPHILELINTEKPTSNKTLVGKRTVVNGGIEILMKPTKESDYYVSLTNTKAAYKQIIPDSYTIKRGSVNLQTV